MFNINATRVMTIISKYNALNINTCIMYYVFTIYVNNILLKNTYIQILYKNKRITQCILC